MNYNQELVNQVSSRLLDIGNTIAVAEGATSGHLQAALSAATHAPLFYEGGITVYNVKQKVQLLDVEPEDAVSSNSVSEKVAVQMALQCSRIFMSNIGVGITGYTSPPLYNERMELYACFAITRHGWVVDSGTISNYRKEKPADLQFYYTEKLLERLAETLAGL